MFVALLAATPSCVNKATEEQIVEASEEKVDDLGAKARLRGEVALLAEIVEV